MDAKIEIEMLRDSLEALIESRDEIIEEQMGCMCRPCAKTLAEVYQMIEEVEARLYAWQTLGN